MEDVRPSHSERELPPIDEAEHGRHIESEQTGGWLSMGLTLAIVAPLLQWAMDSLGMGPWAQRITTVILAMGCGYMWIKGQQRRFAQLQQIAIREHQKL